MQSLLSGVYAGVCFLGFRFGHPPKTLSSVLRSNLHLSITAPLSSRGSLGLAAIRGLQLETGARSTERN